MSFRKIKTDPRQRSLFFQTGGSLNDKKREDEPNDVIQAECPVCSGTGHMRADVTQTCFKCGGQGYLEATPQTLTQTMREPIKMSETVNSLAEIKKVIDPNTLNHKPLNGDAPISLRDVYNLLLRLFELNTKIYTELTEEPDDEAEPRRRYDTKGKILQAMQDGKTWSIYQLWEQLKLEEPRISQNAVSGAARSLWQEQQLEKLQKGIYRITSARDAA